MKLFCKEDHDKPFMYDIAKSLEQKIDLVLRSNAAVQVNYDADARMDYPVLLKDIVKIVKLEIERNTK